MLKLAFIFVIGIAYAAQTRIKIGSKSWGYQIDLNQGQNVRSEFASEEGITHGTYIFKAGNETKQLNYRIDPNRKEPDIAFNVAMVNPDKPGVLDVNTTSKSITISGNDILEAGKNMSFDTIDSNQDFKGHMTLKVGNASYSLNFLTGDKSNSREETMTANGMLYGRFHYQLANSPTAKVVINYKFNSTAPDPVFEVSLHKMSDYESIASFQRDRENYRSNRPYERISDRLHMAYPRTQPPAAYPAHTGRPPVRASQSNPSYPANPEKGSRANSNNPNYNPNWYYNRAKVYEP